MSDNLTYDPLGTVTVTIDDKPYKLGRPKMKHYRYFARRLNEIVTETQAKLAALSDAVRVAQAMAEEEDTEEAHQTHEYAKAELVEFTKQPFFETSSELLREMFHQLGDELPEDLDEWPVFLAADTSLPGQIIQHWRDAPKASGSKPNQ